MDGKITPFKDPGELGGGVADGGEGGDPAHVDVIGHEEAFGPVGAVGGVAEGEEVGGGGDEVGVGGCAGAARVGGGEGRECPEGEEEGNKENCGLQIADCGLKNTGSGDIQRRGAEDAEVRRGGMVDCGLRIVDCGLKNTGFRGWGLGVGIN